MSAAVAERIRLIIDTEERLRRAVRIAAARQGKSPSEVVNDLITEHLSEDVQAADDALADEADDKPTKRKP